MEREMKLYLGAFLRWTSAAILVFALALLLDDPSELILRVIALVATALTAAFAIYLLWKYRRTRGKFREMIMSHDADEP